MKESIQQILISRGWNNKKIIAAVSGGIDSMVLADVLRQAGVEMIIAHCNFGLRGAESDGDEQLVKSWAERYRIPFYVQHFPTLQILKEKGGNLQETARNLRYNWFEELRIQQGFDLIATAHHAQDSVETLLINLLKGTGISGLHGILPQQQNIIRPLLDFYKDDIRKWATDNNLQWREDSSNKKDNYTRNAIRHQILPVMEQILPGSIENLRRNTERFREIELLYQESITRYRKKLLEKRNNDWYLPIRKLQNCQPLNTILWELLKPFHFSPGQLADIRQLMKGETGHYVSSASHRIIRNRDFLIITTTATEQSTHILIEEDTRKVASDNLLLDIVQAEFNPALMSMITKSGKNVVYIDRAKLKFPLLLRPWKTGDYFYPIGMGMKKKKVSRFLISEKLGLHEKDKIWVLESNKKIVWVVGLRMDERFKLLPATRNYVKFTFSMK